MYNYSKRPNSFRCVSVLVLSLFLIIDSNAAAVCQAATVTVKPSTHLSKPATSSLEKASIILDPILHQSWERIDDYLHPEWPLHLVLRPIARMDNGLLFQSPESVKPQKHESIIVIHAGNVVKLWRYEDSYHIEMTGVCEESGPIGKRVRVRLSNPSLTEQESYQQRFGIIRGYSNVELQQ